MPAPPGPGNRFHEEVRVLLAPGQGTWSAELVDGWLDHAPTQRLLTEWSPGVGVDLPGLTAAHRDRPAREVPQVVVAALGLAAAASLPPGWAELATGHSLGEWTAAGVAGVLAPRELLRMVALRGAATSSIAAWADTGMAAVLGGDPAEVDSALAAAGLTAANRNGRGQVVAAGPRAGLETLLATPPRGARVRLLDVPIAFHTPLLAPVSAALLGHVVSGPPRSPSVPLVSTQDGSVLRDGQEALRRLAEQTSRPVRFDLCWATLRELGAGVVVELPPAGTLSALARRELPGVEVLALRTPADLPALAGTGAAR